MSESQFASELHGVGTLRPAEGVRIPCQGTAIAAAGTRKIPGTDNHVIGKQRGFLNNRNVLPKHL